MEGKQERLEQANRAIEIIASHGRRFFSLCAEGRNVQPNRISHFELRNNRLWFIDKWTQKPIYVAYRRGQWRGFSEGGTLRSLIEQMADWIIGKRRAFPMTHLGPWPKCLNDGDLWGYGEEMNTVRYQVDLLLRNSNPQPGTDD